MKQFISLLSLTFVLAPSIASACVQNSNSRVICIGDQIQWNGQAATLVATDDIQGLMTITFDGTSDPSMTSDPATDPASCRVPTPNLGNPHRNYDAKFRSCRAKAVELGFGGQEQRACIAYCMRN